MRDSGGLLLIVLVLVVTGWSATFTIDETELAIVTQFGDFKRKITEPGLHFKIPFVQTVSRMERRILGSESPPSSYLTRDKKRLVVDPITRWRVEDPLPFYTSVRDELGAKARLDDRTNSELRRELASRDFGELVCVPRAAATRGIGAGPSNAGAARDRRAGRRPARRRSRLRRRRRRPRRRGRRRPSAAASAGAGAPPGAGRRVRARRTGHGGARQRRVRAPRVWP
jgi:HflC protein